MTIELAPHQQEAVERALAMLAVRTGLLLADDAGLGKSYVAAAVAQTLPPRTCEFIVPAGLVAQWTETLAQFEVDARITTHDRIAGEPFVARPEDDRVIVVDEAHAFRNPQTQRYDALARRSIGARLLLITATPVCNSPDDLYALVSLIAADDAFRADGVPSIEEAFRARAAGEIAVILDALVIRRGRDALDERFRFGTLERHIAWHEVMDVAIDELRFPLVGGERALLRNILWRRLESSEAALLDSLRRQRRFYERALDCLASGKSLSKRDYRNAFGDEDANAFQEVLFWEAFAGDDTRADADEIRAEMTRIDAIRRMVDAAPRRKLQQLLDRCRGDDAILIFTSAIATANDLYQALRAVRRAGVVTSRNASPPDAIDAFRRGAIDVLVCTDLAAEGLNLQRANVVVHYDVPWNPVRLDQRNGRAFRIGQQRDVVRAIYFLPRGRRTRIVQTVASKNRARRMILDRRRHDAAEVGGAPLGGSPRGIVEPEIVASRLALPQRLTRGAPAVTLLAALRRRGLDPPHAIRRRHRAGLERLFAEMAREYIDPRRVADLTALTDRERIIGSRSDQ